MLIFLIRVELTQSLLTLNHRKVFLFGFFFFSCGEQRQGAGGLLCVGFVLLDFSFYGGVVSWGFFFNSS